MTRAPKLILWDVDGTLVWTGPATRVAFDRAVASVLQQAIGDHEVSFGGKTDPQIALEIMSALSVSDEEAREHLPGVIQALEREMKSAGAWVFGGRLHDPDTATVVRVSGNDVLTTDGPFVESKEHLGGFYIIKAEDLDAALAWASKVTRAIHMPIEVRPFYMTEWPSGC